jgi:polyisoprenoid-binding protein YceI
MTESDDFTSASKIEFTADVDSINTNNEQRDVHLKSANFLDSGQYLVIKFIGNLFEKYGNDYLLHGNLTIKSINRPLTLEVNFGGIVVDPYGQIKAGFTVSGKISRKQFDLTWNGVTEAGQIVVSDEIKINCDIQLVKRTQKALQIPKNKGLHQTG